MAFLRKTLTFWAKKWHFWRTFLRSLMIFTNLQFFCPSRGPPKVFFYPNSLLDFWPGSCMRAVIKKNLLTQRTKLVNIVWDGSFPFLLTSVTLFSTIRSLGNRSVFINSFCFCLLTNRLEQLKRLCSIMWQPDLAERMQLCLQVHFWIHWSLTNLSGSLVSLLYATH
jgi:hypothetical protein